MRRLAHNLRSAGEELSDAQIKARLGHIVEAGLRAFRSDFGSPVEVVESSARDRDHALALAARRRKAREAGEIALPRVADMFVREVPKVPPEW